MKVLNSEELGTVETALESYFPQSLKVYGYIFAINRNKPHTLDVLVDSWPDFKTVICRPDSKNERSADFLNKVTVFSKEAEGLRSVLAEHSAVDWSACFMVGGLDVNYATVLKEAAAYRGIRIKLLTVEHLMRLQDPSRLPDLKIDSDTAARISSLNESHVGLVNQAWKFGGGEQSFRLINKLISCFPSCCITDDGGSPISWVLLYDYCALGMLYTAPEHRGKGYAKILVSTIARRLHAQGYPVYCFIEEENELSYRLFKGLGFTEAPDYRTSWYELNY
ncbi:glycine N-acyltransferase-like protein 3 [Lepisosteus oculatus]|uniref:glycine N-acyltransferase-like protein 3 n=1 Tax=Lepisosteus oculatus TaxID=7918 RepID=UPI0035F50109